MKSENYTKWNLWHKANDVMNEPEKLHFPDVLKSYNNPVQSKSGET